MAKTDKLVMRCSWCAGTGAIQVISTVDNGYWYRTCPTCHGTGECTYVPVAGTEVKRVEAKR